MLLPHIKWLTYLFVIFLSQKALKINICNKYRAKYRVGLKLKIVMYQKTKQENNRSPETAELS